MHPHAGMGMVGSILVQAVLDTADLHGIIDFDLASGGATGKSNTFICFKKIFQTLAYME